MAIHRGTRHIGGIGTPGLQVPSGVILGGLAVVLAIGVLYVLATIRGDESPGASEPVALPEFATMSLTSSAVTRVETNAAEVDSQEFILQQAGVAPYPETKATVAEAPLAPTGAAGSPPEQSMTLPGHVEIGMAEVDTQAYILSEAGPALRYDDAP